ncbi:hypothetical protein HPS8415995_1507 [Glaesserella parasuis 84-15995]|nr:hypothetical protein HPS8415995_1507 [Glaesserella parasuis 84-15995]
MSILTCGFRPNKGYLTVQMGYLHLTRNGFANDDIGVKQNYLHQYNRKQQARDY